MAHNAIMAQCIILLFSYKGARVGYHLLVSFIWEVSAASCHNLNDIVV